jgi:curved DNA-binding protein CbpA
MFKDYYAILDISQLATLTEIKSAYRTQAMKWHPDKNYGMDTTEKMKEINEAKLILTDEEARSRYDREYLRFKSFQQEKTNQTEVPKQKHQEHKKQDNNTNQNTKDYNTEKPKEEYSSYQFYDETLKKWIENARNQAIRNVQEMIIEFRESSLVGFGTFFKTAIMAIVIGAIFFVILQILKAN